MGSPQVVLDNLPAHDDHGDGRRLIGPDSKLYLSRGDQGSNFLADCRNRFTAASQVDRRPRWARANWSSYKRHDPDIVTLDPRINARCRAQHAGPPTLTIPGTTSPSGADGIRCDVDGNIWAGPRPGVQVIAPTGEVLGMIRLPETCANVCFGGTKRNRLFMTASQSLCAVYVNTAGAHIA